MVALLVAGCATPAQSPAPSAQASAPVTTAPTRPASPEPSGSGSAGTPTPSTAPSPVDLGGIGLTLEPFASVPGGPLAMTAPDDGSGRLIVAAQDGKIWLIDADGTARTQPMVDLGPILRSGGEQGLLGIDLHPSFPTDPRVFVNYTNGDGDTVIASLTLDAGDDTRIDFDSHRQVLFIDQPYANHNGGDVAFGPDGYLYLSLGDGGSGGDPQNNGQRLDTLLGKILRIDVNAPNGSNPYVVPSDNPFAGGGGLPEIWLTGLRNPWRMSFDRESGDLWIADVGQSGYEEIDVARAGVGGLNFGWKVMEGAHCFNAESCDRTGLTLPVSEYGREIGCTVIGGYVYRGATFDFLRGAYLFADYCTDRLMAIDAASEGLDAPVEVGSGGPQISAWGEDAAGELYVLTLSGAIAKVVATER